jgi:hypothetical protein
VQRQAFVGNQRQVGVPVEGNLGAALQRQPVLAADARDQRIDEGHIHRIRRMAAQTQQHRPVAGVPPTRGAQRAIQRAAHARHLRHAPAARQALHKQPRRAHGPHGVRAGRAYADLEKVENADGHGQPPV